MDLKSMSTPELHALRSAVAAELYLRIAGEPLKSVSVPVKSTTDDPNDPRLGRGVDEHSVPQQDVYLILSGEERSKGFIRPLRTSYVHVGIAGPKYPLRDLTAQEKDLWGHDWIKYEEFPNGPEGGPYGRFWTQKELDSVGKGCGTKTTMGLSIAETYARNPMFYGSTYCCGCMKHRPVGVDGEFVWDGTDERVGT